MQMVDLEGGREALRKELENVRRKMATVEEEFQKKLREQQTALEDQARTEQQGMEQRHQLELALEAVGIQLADVRVELGAAHGRVEALETQLSKVCGEKSLQLTHFCQSARLPKKVWGSWPQWE